MKRRAKVDYARWVFVLPALLVVGILLIYPIFSSLYYSMTTKHLIRLTYDFIGLENYKAVLADPNFFKAFLNSSIVVHLYAFAPIPSEILTKST